MERIFKLIYYVVYIITISLFYGLIRMVTMTLDGDMRFEVDRIINLATLVMPFVFFQIVTAIFVVRNLSLKKIFFISTIFTIASCILSYIISPLLIIPGPVYIIAFHWNLLELLFMLGIPVLILTIAQRRRTKDMSQPTVKNAQVDDSDEIEVGMLKSQQCENKPPCKSYWWYLDIGLAIVPLWFLILIDPFGIVNYLCGLINVPIHLFALFSSVLMLPIGVVCIVLFLVRMIIIWPRHIRPWPRLLLSWAIVIGGICLWIGPFFIHVLPGPFQRYACGLRRHVQATTDIEAIQSWLSTLDPNNIQGKWLDMNIQPDVRREYTSRIIPAPNAIIRLRPKISRFELDDSGRPMIRLMWGSGVMGSWGYIFGDKDVEIPETELPGHKEIRSGRNMQSSYGSSKTRLPIAPGVYVWYDLE